MTSIDDNKEQLDQNKKIQFLYYIQNIVIIIKNNKTATTVMIFTADMIVQVEPCLAQCTCTGENSPVLGSRIM